MYCYCVFPGWIQCTNLGWAGDSRDGWGWNWFDPQDSARGIAWVSFSVCACMWLQCSHSTHGSNLWVLKCSLWPSHIQVTYSVPHQKSIFYSFGFSSTDPYMLWTCFSKVISNSYIIQWWSWHVLQSGDSHMTQNGLYYAQGKVRHEIVNSWGLIMLLAHLVLGSVYSPQLQM